MRLALISLLGIALGALGSGCDSATSKAARIATSNATSVASSAATNRPNADSSYPTPQHALQLRQESVDKRGYALFSATDKSHWQVTLKRPRPEDRATLLCVPGTYTSPQNDVEGLVMIAGKPVRHQRMAWEALLVIEPPRLRIEHVDQRGLSQAALQRFEHSGASLLQGHLLVAQGKPRPLKPSPKLQRRALVSTATGPRLIESIAPVELAVFAADLVNLGARAAMNLDMGKWSEGWYRRPNGDIMRIGHDRRATRRQSNWLVLRQPQQW